jgi:hypothetical protein
MTADTNQGDNVRRLAAERRWRNEQVEKYTELAKGKS